MKILALTIAAALAFSGCKKEKESNSLNSTELAGTWELRQVQGGMTPTATYAAGNGNQLRFTATNYERYANGSLQKSGPYQLVSDTTVKEAVGLQLPSGQFNTRIVFDNNLSGPKTFIDLREGKLQLVSGYFPLDSGIWQVYEKVADAQKPVP